jgi:1-acyl-sn-glycerol-3-phosphate acyltransferase
MITQAVRSALFYALFLVQTAILAIVVGTIGLIVKRRTPFTWALARFWGWFSLFLLRWTTGIRTRVEGAENIPEGPCIIAAKHQSDWDVLALLPFLSRPAYIAKTELMRIPFFGWAARSIDTIAIDRALGAEAIPAMLADARAAVAKGCQVVIYPEGTRKAPLARAEYRQGVVRLYQALGVPVVPVALNSGLFWSRNSPVLWPGVARAKFLPAIPPGLEGPAFRAQLIETIEGETDRLIFEEVERGLSRPIGPELEERIVALRARMGFPEETTTD